MLKHFLATLTALALTYCLSATASEDATNNTPPTASDTAVFAMGCFWSGEAAFRNPSTHELLHGILDIKVGYAGGKEANPTYENHPGYKEAVKVTFDPEIISYEKLLDVFWHHIDPLDKDGQFCDRGASYTSVIYTHSAQQVRLAETQKVRYQQTLNRGILTQILPFTTFYPAEEYHQNYKTKNPNRYRYYSWRCGRDQRLQEIWGKKP